MKQNPKIEIGLESQVSKCTRPGTRGILQPYANSVLSLSVRYWRIERLDGVRGSASIHASSSHYLNEDGYRGLQARLAGDPEAGDLIAGTGGFRKMRWADVRRGKGRRGGLRVIYYYFASGHQIWLMTVYDKDEASDLSVKQKEAAEGFA